MSALSADKSLKGSAEYAISLLQGTERACPHPKKLEPGRKDGVPYRLGFFFHTDMGLDYNHLSDAAGLGSKFSPVLNLDIKKLCRECYNDAVPDGYNTWSMDYNFRTLKEESDGKRRETRRYGNLPLQLTPGPGGLAPHLVRDSGELKPFGNNVFLPEAFEFLQHIGKPFYLDVLNLTEQWDFNAPREQQQAQLDRVGLENGLGYDFAANVYVADGSGGYGPWTTAEQRRSAERLKVVPARWRETLPGDDPTPSETWSIVPTLPHENYNLPWPTDPDFTLDAIPFEELLKHQREANPNTASAYLSNADRVIEQYYRENPDNHYHLVRRQALQNSQEEDQGKLFHETVHHVKSTRWPEEPQHAPLSKDMVDEKNAMMGPGFDQASPWEVAKYDSESGQRTTWDARDRYLDSRARIKRIRDLYKSRGVPENLWPPLPDLGSDAKAEKE